MQFPKVTVVLLLAEFFSQTSAAVLATHGKTRLLNTHGKARRDIDGNMVLKRTGTSTSSVPNLTLDSSAVQTGSELTGNDPPVAGQATSATSNNNFINFCVGETLTNGLQNPAGSCNGIPMGKIPAEANTVSTIILSPQPGETVPANQAFNVSLQTIHLNVGTFTNSANTYYSAPSDLDSNGDIVGHVHVTIQSLGSSLTPTTPPDPTTFAFFLGIENAGNGQGLLQAPVTNGLDAGFYRVCTIAGSSNHQPVLSAIAKRGAQDDCTKFVVGGPSSSSSSAGSNSGSATTGTKTSSSSSTSSATVAAVVSASSTSTSAVATSSTSAASSSSSSSSSTTSFSAIGGIAAPSVTTSTDPTRPFLVNGNTFVNKAAAVQRACAIQNNACANAVNSGTVTGFNVGDCNTQETACNAATS